MKLKTLFIVIVFISSLDCAAQAEDTTRREPEVFNIVDEMPEFPGGNTEMMKFIANTMTYPAAARQNKEGGRCFLKFIVAADGSITNIDVLKSSGCTSCDKEAKRVVSQMPKWKPGKHHGKEVPVAFNLPITFSISNPPR